MSKRKWTAIILACGLTLGIGTCVSDLGTYAIDTLTTYLPEILDTLLDSATETA